MSLHEIWAAKTDEQVIAAGRLLKEFTEEAQRVILQELARRGFQLADTTETKPIEPPFFAVSLLKFSVLSFCTFGFYNLYWFHQHWQRVSERQPKAYKIRPIWRAIFSPAFCYSLCQEIDDYSRQLQLKTSIIPAGITFVYVVLAVLSQIGNVEPFFAWVALFTFVPLLKVQRQANLVNEAAFPGGGRNVRFSKWNVLTVLIGGSLALLGLIATFTPGKSEPQPQKAFGPSATEIKLSKLIHLSPLVAEEDREARVTGAKDLARLAAAVSESTKSYCISKMIRDFTKTSGLGDHIQVKWRADHVQPDQFHIAQSSFNNNRDEWITIGQDHYENAGLWLEPAANNRIETERHLKNNDFVMLLKLSTPSTATAFTYEQHHYLRFEYPPEQMPNEVGTVLQEIAKKCTAHQGNNCQLFVWVDMDSKLIVKGEFLYQGKNSEGADADIDIQQAFTAYNQPIVVRKPKLNTARNGNGENIIADSKIDVIPFYN